MSVSVTSQPYRLDVNITNLQQEYTKVKAQELYSERALTLHTDTSSNLSGFCGSQTVIFVTSGNSLTCEAPGCIAAPLVNLVAKNSIDLGKAGKGSQNAPLRLYISSQVSITTKHLSIGDLQFWGKTPEHGHISCKKLTLIKPKSENPDYFELVKSWAINDDMEVEILRRE